MHCTPSCAHDYAAAMRDVAEQLTKEGFTPDEHTPNIWRKDGVGITLEEALNDGIEAVSEKHTRIAACLGAA